MNLHEHLSHWESFYMLVGTAGATLAGLTFVAVASGERLMRGGNTMTPLQNDPATQPHCWIGFFSSSCR